MLRWINIYAACTGITGFGVGMMTTELIRGVGFIGSFPMGLGFSLVIVGLAGAGVARTTLKRNPAVADRHPLPSSNAESESN